MKAFMAFPICSLVYIVILSIIYFYKPRINTIENNIYKNIMITNIVGLILEILCYLAVEIVDSYYLIAMLILKGYVIYIFIWSLVFNIYVFITTYNKPEISELESYYKKIKFMSFFISLIFTVVVFLLPIHIYNDGLFAYTYGTSVNLLVILCGTIVTTWIFKCIVNIKSIKGKKYVPIIACILVLLLVFITQSINRAILIATTGHSIIIFLMYFTIENPDVKMLEQLNIAKEQAERANNAKSDFLSSMSHEIRTPLNAIVGFSQALQEENLPQEAKEEVNDIVMASETLLDIVNGILDISKIEANKLEIVNTEYNFNEMLDELVSLTKARLGEKPLEFKCNFDPSIPNYLYGDRVRVKQVILNLLTNAVKYTKEGSIEFKVSSVQKNGVCRLIISVEDTGRGIKKENIDKLFTKFQRLEEDKNTTIEGTGLGLAITKKLIELMGGQIVVQSIYGRGSRFTIAIDQRVVENPTVVVESLTADTEVSDKLDLSNRKVLIVDDNKINLKVASRLLQDYSCIIETLDSGFECIEKIKSGSTYDLILMDDMMPKMSGTETLHNLKTLPNFNMPVVALTANAISGMREKYLAEGFDDYLSKPIDKNDLNRVLVKFLSQK